MMNYVLMNRDTPILRFSCIHDRFDEVICREEERIGHPLPRGSENLTTYLDSRQAPKHRKHIALLLAKCGCSDLEGYLKITHALSLNDTIWVKAVGEDLTWKDVNLYRNDFNELIARAAFSGVVDSLTLSSTSPEFSTDGAFAKCWVREGQNIFLYKKGSDRFGLEPLSEYLASQLATFLEIHAVRYDLSFEKGELISKCMLFTDEKIGLCKIRELMPRGEHRLEEVYRIFRENGAEAGFREMCVYDALILNTDRHLGNFGFLQENERQAIIGMAPLYDHNRSLLYDMDNDQLREPEWCLSTCRPRLANDFITVAREMLDDTLRKKLKRLEDFSSQNHPQIFIEEERLALLSEIVKKQMRTILK